MAPAAAARRFDVALSFPGERRRYVKGVAKQLAEKFTARRVLYDAYHSADFARVDLDVYLPGLYRTQSELIVLFLCPEYATKSWCKLEWRNIRQLIATADAGRIMLLSFGDPGDLTEIGVQAGDGYLDIGKRSAAQTAAAICERLDLNRESVAAQPRRPGTPSPLGEPRPTRPRLPKPPRDVSRVPAPGATPSTAPALAPDVAVREVKEWLEARLATAPTAASLLARELAAAEPTGAIAGALKDPAMATRLQGVVAAGLLAATAKVAAAAIDEAHRQAVSADRAVLEEVLFKVLPFAADLAEARRSVAEADRRNDASVELPFRTETLAEIIVAGAGGQPAAVIPGRATPEGAGSVALPSAAYVPLFSEQHQVFAQAVAVALARQDGPASDRLAAIGKRFTNPEEIRIAVRDVLVLLQKRHKWARYLLFIDEDLRSTHQRSLDKLWGLTCGALSGPHGLAGLRLIRLRGGPEQLAHEYGIVLHLTEVLARR